MTSPSSMNEKGHSKAVHWDNPEGWDGERGGRGVWDGGTHVHPWLIHVSVWPKPPQDCKVISLQLKYINTFLKKDNLFISNGWHSKSQKDRMLEVPSFSCLLNSNVS